MSLHVRHPGRVEQITQQAAVGLRQSLLANPEEYEALRKAHDPPTLLEWVGTPECGVCFLYVNRPVRTRMPGGVGRAG
jgi:hypothetical protein